MNELLIKKQKYLRFPAGISNFDKSPEEIEKLSLHYCSNSEIIIDDNWKNLKYVEIYGCKYFQFSLKFNTKYISKLEQILFVSSDYIDILDIQGYLPLLSEWEFKSCQYVKFKGKIKGDIGINIFKFHGVPQLKLFKKEAQLKNLEKIHFLDGCNFLKLNLAPLRAPNLRELWFKNSNYINLISMGKIKEQLNSFKFENCAYPKLNIDFSKLAKLSLSNSNSNNTQLIDNKQINQYQYKNKKQKKSPFRKFKKRSSNIDEHIKRRKKLRRSPDIKLIKETISQEESLKSAENFLNNLSLEKKKRKKPENKILEKFCPDCGIKNLKAAEYCSKCGNKFPKL